MDDRQDGDVREAINAPAGRAVRLGQVTAVMALSFLLRLGLGLLQPPEADEATLGVAALRLLHGHLITMESNAHYLGAAGVYIVAPFVAVLGPTTLALRLPMSLLGAVTVLLMYALGRSLWGRHVDGLAAAGLAAVFPLFAVLFTVRSQWAYGEVVPLEAALLLLTVRIGWRGRRKARDWCLLGLIGGVALWTTPLLAVVIIPCAAALVLRGPVMGWRSLGRGAALALVGAVVGLPPWLAYNASHQWGSLTGIPRQRTGIRHAVHEVLVSALPIFAGSQRSCAPVRTIPPELAAGLVLLLLMGAALTRREALWGALHGRWGALEPVDLILIIAPISIASVTIGSFNAVSCEPRYLLPLTAPLVVSGVVALRHWRGVTIVMLAAWLMVETVTTVRTPRLDNVTVAGPVVPADVASLVPALEEQRLQAIYADYWLSRPLLFASSERLPMAEYNGYVGFPGLQRAADEAKHPSWLFVQGSPDIARLEQACRNRGITFRRVQLGSLVLDADLSAPLRPADLGVSVDPSKLPLVPRTEDDGGQP
ncbi:MAG: ArnT family glycosyltransferase [Candidatus Dormibacteria bacterium]